ncbi:MAG: hypothetical protein ACTHK3_05870 [Solirubrobacterales bacterium]
MRKLPLLLVFLLISLFAVAGPARALSVPGLPTSAEEAEETEEGEVESEEAETEEGEECALDTEEGESCEEAEETVEAEECVIEDATATVAADPGNDTVRLTIRYRALKPAAVAIDARLRGGKGGLHLGADHTRFRRAGVFHDSFGLNQKEMARAVAAREFAIELHAVNTPASCRMHLTAHRGGGRKLLWS